MFQIKVTETNGKQWNFDQVDADTVEVWTSVTGNDGDWFQWGTIPFHEAIVQVSVLAGNAKRNY
jgi:hypothetical protein